MVGHLDGATTGFASMKASAQKLLDVCTLENEIKNEGKPKRKAKEDVEGGKSPKKAKEDKEKKKKKKKKDKKEKKKKKKDGSDSNSD
jgi:hypothetical protein